MRHDVNPIDGEVSTQKHGGDNSVIGYGSDMAVLIGYLLLHLLTKGHVHGPGKANHNR
jgi:hypothetical protein